MTGDFVTNVVVVVLVVPARASDRGADRQRRQYRHRGDGAFRETFHCRPFQWNNSNRTERIFEIPVN